LRSFVLRTGDEIASTKLIQIAEAPGLTFAERIEALSGAGVGNAGKRGRDLLVAMSQDITIPPAWRLKAASGGRQAPRKNSNTVDVILDAGVSTRVRVAALKEQKLPSDAELALLAEIANTAGLGSWDRLFIAEAALDLKASGLIERLLEDILADAPHSIAELANAAEIFHAMGNDRRAGELLKKILQIPDIVIEETEDHEPTIEAAELLAKLGHPEQARQFLRRIIEFTGRYEIKAVLNAIYRIGGESEAQEAAQRLLPQLITEANDPTNRYMGYWRELFEEFLIKGCRSPSRCASREVKYCDDRGDGMSVHQSDQCQSF
jgi:tetratricopeptide (TPR) repeat protein